MSFLFPSPTITFEAALRDLANGSPKARAGAAAALGDVTDPVEKRRAADALIRALDDDRPDVRTEACAALGELGDSGALPHLIKRLDDGVPSVRQNAAIALGTLRLADGFDALATALAEGPADLRFQAATSLAEIDPGRAFDLVMTALDDDDAQVVAAAALSVGAIAREDRTHEARARSTLLPKLEHVDASTRFDVAYALAELGEPAGKSVLAGAVHDVERAWDAVSALGQLAAKDELGKAVASKKTPPEARVLAAGALLGLDPADEGARRVLLEGLMSRRVNVRGVAIEQLERVGGAWAMAPLEKLARSGIGVELQEPVAAALRAIEGRT